MNRPRLILASLAVLLCGCAGESLRRVPATVPPVRSPEFREELAATAKTPWTTGNSVRTLENGDGFFPPMLRAAASAKTSITFECYVGTDSEVAATFSRVFARRAKAGVKVHVVLDAFGCCLWGGRNLSTMRRAGVQVKFYSRFNPLNPPAYARRTHRRVLVVDGSTGFCGAAGFAANWYGDADSRDHWRDTQYEMHGPVVAQLQDHFRDHWQELTGTVLSGRDYYPPLPKAGTLTAQMIAGAPKIQGDTIGASCLLAIRAARKSILMEQSYFIPPPAITDALLAAAARGVRVRIILPGDITDMPFSKEVTLRPLRRMMDAGVEIYEYLPTMMHGKLITIDDHLVIAGSGNLNAYSFFINEDNNLHVLDPGFAHEQRRMFERDLARSARLTEETLRISPARRLRGLVGPIVFGKL